MSFPDHVHELDAEEKDAGAAKVFEAEHRSGSAFDGTVVLFHDVVQICNLAYDDRLFALDVDSFQSRHIRAALLVGAWRWRVPLLASGIMLAWDLSMEADWATVDRAWLWRDGGMFFGVPISNFLGWFLVAFLYYAAFDFYLARTRAVRSSSVPSRIWRTAIAMYAICALGNLLLFAKPMAPTVVVDPSGIPWKAETILIAGGSISVFVMGSVALIAWMRLRTMPRAINDE